MPGTTHFPGPHYPRTVYYDPRYGHPSDRDRAFLGLTRRLQFTTFILSKIALSRIHLSITEILDHLRFYACFELGHYLEKENIEYIDIFSYVNDHRTKEAHFQGDGHWNQYGHYLVARGFFELIRDKYL